MPSEATSVVASKTTKVDDSPSLALFSMKLATIVKMAIAPKPSAAACPFPWKDSANVTADPAINIKSRKKMKTPPFVETQPISPREPPVSKSEWKKYHMMRTAMMALTMRMATRFIGFDQSSLIQVFMRAVLEAAGAENLVRLFIDGDGSGVAIFYYYSLHADHSIT